MKEGSHFFSKFPARLRALSPINEKRHKLILIATSNVDTIMPSHFLRKQRLRQNNYLAQYHTAS